MCLKVWTCQGKPRWQHDVLDRIMGGSALFLLFCFYFVVHHKSYLCMIKFTLPINGERKNYSI